jgi:hypothetical protein
VSFRIVAVLSKLPVMGKWLTAWALLIGFAGAGYADDLPPTTRPAADVSLFRDPETGEFDVSNFLATRTGLLPAAIPISEPAVGFGLGVGLAFFHETPKTIDTPTGERIVPPTTTAVFGMGTDNGSWAAGGGHLHEWNDGRVRYAMGGGYASLNLDWFGRNDAFAGHSFGYNMEATGVFQKLTFKLGDSDFFLGPTQRLIVADTEFDISSLVPENVDVPSSQLHTTVSGVGVTLGYDTRNSLFSPTKGTKASVSYTQNADVIGSDFNYGRLDAEICQYFYLGGPYTLGVRVAGGYAGDNAPFFDLPGISQRGIQVGRYVDSAAFSTETELRYDLTPRWTLVGFVGTGATGDNIGDLWNARLKWSGGAGFRYLVARAYELRMGLDVAHGPEDWAVYVTLGTGWLRD